MFFKITGKKKIYGPDLFITLRLSGYDVFSFAYRVLYLFIILQFALLLGIAIMFICNLVADLAPSPGN